AGEHGDIGRAALPAPARAGLFDYLVGASEQRWWHFEAQRLCSLEIDDQLVLGRRLHRQVSGLLAPENAVNVAGRATVLADGVRSVAGKPSRGDKVAVGVDGWQSMVVGKSQDQI